LEILKKIARLQLQSSLFLSIQNQYASYSQSTPVKVKLACSGCYSVSHRHTYSKTTSMFL